MVNLPLFSQETDKTFSIHVKNISFNEFATMIWNEIGSQVFYKSEWTKDIVVTLDTDSISVLSALNTVLKTTSLKTSLWNNNYIILPEEELIDSLPDFSYKNLLTDSSIYDQGDNDKTFLTGRSSDVLKSMTVGNKNNRQVNAAKITGKISDIESGEPIVGATIYIKEIKMGSVTDLKGNISLTLKPGKYIAQFECMGYQKTSYQMEIISDGSFNVELIKAFIPLDEATIYGDRQMSLVSKDPGIEKITVKSIKEIPMMLGERDILKVSEFLPGIVSVGEGSSGLNVRGGNFDQNAFYLNKVPIYNTSHFFGFFTSFNADIINDFTIYKGHVPAQFGGKLSSVFDIVTRKGNKKRFTMHGGITPYSGNITLEIPIIKDSCSFLISGRSSYSDWILTKIDDYLIRNSTAGFYDITSLLSYDLKKTNIDVFFYKSYDHFSLADLNSYEYSNLGGSLSIDYRINSHIKNNFSLISSSYAYGTIDKQEISSAYKHSYHLGHYELRNDIIHSYNNKHTLNYGIDLTLFKLDRGTVEPYGSESERIPISHGKEKALEGALYISDVYDILPGIKLSGGFRYSLYSYLGPQEVFLYLDQSQRDIRYISDTLNFGSHDVIKWYSAPEFRVALNVETDPGGSVKFAFNQMDQNLFMLSNTIALAPNTQWKLADYHLKPSRCNQFSFGIFRNSARNQIETSIEIYYKSINNFPEFKDGANFLFSPTVETEVLQGKQKSYGLEFFVKLNSKKLDGWIAYTYSRSLITVDAKDIWNKINNGMAYPSNFDIPNVLNTIVNYHLSKRVTISSVLCYQTGKPVTYPLSAYYIEEQPYIDYSSRNKYRIPDYFRLDLSLNIEGNLKMKKLLHSSWQFGIYNITGRNNAYSVYYKSEEGRLYSYKYSIIGTQLFTASWLIKIGNFESN